MHATPLRVIRPIVVPALFYFQAPLIAAFVSIFPAVFGTLIVGFLGFSNIDPFAPHQGPNLGVGIAIYALAFVVVIVLLGIKIFRGPEWTAYTIYSDRVESESGIFSRSRETVPYEQVLEVKLTEGILQQGVGAGTVLLVLTQIVGDKNSGLSHRTLALENVPQPREVYEELNSLLLQRRSGGPTNTSVRPS